MSTQTTTRTDLSIRWKKLGFDNLYYRRRCYAAGILADAIGQYAAWGHVDWQMAATSNAAIAGGEAGLLTGVLGGASSAKSLAQTAETATGAVFRLGAPVARVDSYAWAMMSPVQRIAAVVEKYGINLRGRTVVYDPSLGVGQLGMTSAANPGVLRVGSGVLGSEEELAVTIAHELRHSRAFMGSGSNSEAAAQAAEQGLREFIQGVR
jgi:hypothetical protein